MTTPFIIARIGAAAALLLSLGAPEASAHAFLDHAVPSVASTVSAAPETLTLTFTESVVPALSGMRIVGPDGQALALPKATASSRDTLQVRLPGKLKPGIYKVTWHVVSIDTHATSGAFAFTVAP